MRQIREILWDLSYGLLFLAAIAAICAFLVLLVIGFARYPTPTGIVVLFLFALAMGYSLRR